MWYRHAKKKKILINMLGLGYAIQITDRFNIPYAKKTSASTIEYMQMICSLVRHYLFRKNKVEEDKHNLDMMQLFLLQ